MNKPFEQNLERLWALVGGQHGTPYHIALLDELGHAAKNWRTERNSIAHGMTQDAMEDDATILSVRGKRVKVADLERAVERARHVAVIAAQLEMDLVGLARPHPGVGDAQPARPRPRPPGLN